MADYNDCSWTPCEQPSCRTYVDFDFQLNRVRHVGTQKKSHICDSCLAHNEESFHVIEKSSGSSFTLDRYQETARQTGVNYQTVLKDNYDIMKAMSDAMQ